MDFLLRINLDGQIEQITSPQTIVPEIVSGSSKLSEPAEIVANTENTNIEALATIKADELEAIDTARQTGDWALYGHYISSVGWWRFVILAGAHLISAALDNFPSWFPKLHFIVALY